MLVAAGVFVASRWDQLADVLKLAMLLTGTASCAWFGHRLKATLPATGSVVFHLGLLLVPANLAAVAIHLGVSLGSHLLAQGCVGLALFTVAASATGSAVLRWASISAAPVAAVGIAALTPIPALGVLVAFALVAELLPQLRSRDAVVAWSAMAGFGPFVVAAISALAPHPFTSSVINTLSVGGSELGHTAWATGLGAAAILGWRADRTRDLTLATLAIGSALTGFLVTLSTAQVSAREGSLGLAAAFVLVETLALATRPDPFWSKPFAVLADLTEMPAFLGTAVTGFAVLVMSTFEGGHFWNRDPQLAAGFFTAAAAWFIADLRRASLSDRHPLALLVAGARTVHANLAIALCLPAAIVMSGVSPTVAGVVLAGLVAAFTAAQRSPVPLGLLAGPLAIGLAGQHPRVMVLNGLVISGALMVQATRSSRAAKWSGSAFALAAAASGLAVWAIHLGVGASATPLVTVAAIAGLAAFAQFTDNALADSCRLWLAVPLIDVMHGPASRSIVVTGAVAAVLAADAIRLRRPELAGVAAVVSHGTVVAVAIAAGLTVPQAGIAVALAAVVWAGFAAIADGPWDQPLLGAAVAAAGISVVLAATDPQALAVTLLLTGALGIAYGFTARSDEVANVGGAAMVVGACLYLNVWHVHSVELYLLPVAAHLAVAGEVLRRRGPVGSWLSAAPAPALLGTAAVLQRLAGGGAEHALIAAAVGAAAVAAGGARRQTGPLLTGTAVLALLGGHESLAALSGVPAWGWIGLVGGALIAAAVGIERTDTNPIDAGRRLVDVIGDQFE